MATLPSNSFVFNYNARDYNSSTYTIPNENGGTLSKDLVWSGSTRSSIDVQDDHITVPLSAYSPFVFSTSGENPVNITSTDNDMTLVFKVKKGTNFSGTNFISNREYSTYNWMARLGGEAISLHTQTSNYSPPSACTYSSGTVVTAVIRVSDLSVEIKNLTDNTSNTIFTPAYNGGSTRFCFFASLHNTSNTPVEFLSGDFYWAYLSREVLTDAEISQVVAFNDNTTVFDLDSTGCTVGYTGGTATVTLTAELSWTAVPSASWITISQNSGSGNATITVTVEPTGLTDRTGTVVFTDTESNTVTYTIVQAGANIFLPVGIIHKNGVRIN